MSTIITILIIAIILIIVGIRVFTKSRASKTLEITANFKDEGGLLSDETTVQLTGEIVTRADVHIDGMHCMNCKNSVTRSLQKMSGVSAAVDLKHGVAHVEATRELSDEEITFAIERLDFKVTGIERF